MRESQTPAFSVTSKTTTHTITTLSEQPNRMDALIHTVSEKICRALSIPTNQTLAKQVIAESRERGQTMKDYKSFEEGNLNSNF